MGKHWIIGQIWWWKNLERFIEKGTGLWWGEQFGISVRHDSLFVLHFLAAQLKNDLLETVCAALGPTLMNSLLKLEDHNGRTPVHVFFSEWSPLDYPNANFFRIMDNIWEMPDSSILELRDSADMTVLHVAVANGQMQTVTTLAEYAGFNSIKNALFGKNNLSALHLAVLSNSVDCLKFLTEKRCNVNLAASVFLKIDGNQSEWTIQTPFQLAAISGHVPLLQTLLKVLYKYNPNCLVSCFESQFECGVLLPYERSEF